MSCDVNGKQQPTYMVVKSCLVASLSSDSAATVMAISATATPLSSINHHCFRNQSMNGTASMLFNRNSIANCRRRKFSISRLSLTHKFFKKSSCGVFTRPLSTVMQWQDCTVKTEIDVPISVAYQCYLDREAIPQWMPFISNVKVLEDKPELSRWSLKYEAFGQDIEYSWLARNMQPIINQKIHWRSLEGLPNRGAVRFFPKGPSSCVVELTVSYEVPQLLSPVATALKPFVESLLARGLERFATFARSYQE